MATTSPDNIRTPDSGDSYALVQDMGILADTVQNALIKRANAYMGTVAQRNAFESSAPTGTIWSDTDGERLVWKKGSSSWESVVDVPEEEDSGWIAVTSFHNGYSSASGRPVRYRKVGKVVMLAGQVEKSTGLTSDEMFSLPSGFHPSQTAAFIAASAGTDVAKIDVRATGDVFLAAAPSGRNYAMLENVRFFTE